MGRDELKLARMVGHGVGLRAHLLGEGAERVVRDLLAVDLDPFVKAHDVGRGVKPRAQPASCRMEASMAQVEPLPFVPVT